MEQNHKNLKKLVKMMRETGVLRYKTAEIEIELAPASISLKPTAQDIQESKQEVKPEYTHDQILFWSAPGIEETQQ